jgi:hypothetical protein
MVAFEVYINKVKICTAGIDDFDAIVGNLVCALDKDGRPDKPKISFHVIGTADKESFCWANNKLTVDDRVEIRIVNTSKVDKPQKIECKGGSCGT